MKEGKYTLPESEFNKIHMLEHLDPTRHNFRSGVWDEAEENGLAINLLNPHYQQKFKTDESEYILWFADGTPLGWFSHMDANWVLPKLKSGMPSPSLYRISTYIRGLRDGMIASSAGL